MKTAAIFACLGLLSSTILAAPSQVFIDDHKADCHEEKVNNKAGVSTFSGPLSEGFYTITSPVIDNKDDLIGRGAPGGAELPEPIRTVDSTTGYAQVKWHVVPINGEPNIFILFSGDNHQPTTQSADQVFSEPFVNPIPWQITYQPQHDAYTIINPQTGKGWVADSALNVPIFTRPLIFAPTYPPRFPPSELFTFKRLPDESVAAVDSQKKEEVHVDVTISLEL